MERLTPLKINQYSRQAGRPKRGWFFGGPPITVERCLTG